MKIALAQIDARLGDIEGICARTADVAALASDQGARLLCLPAPLLGGTVPTALFEYANFEHELVTGLRGLAQRVEALDITCLVPALLSYEGVPYFELFVLRRGRVVPVRTLLAQQRSQAGIDPWTPPVFDVGDVRVAVTFDLERDADQLSRGCDVVLYFQAEGFDATRPRTAAAASVSQGCYASEAQRLGAWLACMAPVGGFEDAVFCGGSFVMDDTGTLVACAPAFEEELLVCDVERGVSSSERVRPEPPAFIAREWLWEALRIHLRDTLRAHGYSRAAVPLSGDLPSSLLAVLAVDALGSRNVIGVACERAEVATPTQQAKEVARMACVREVAEALRIRVVERAAGEVSRWMDRDVPSRDVARLRGRIDALFLDDVAHELRAFALSPLTKTAAALAPSLAAGSFASLAPFGDVYLSELEFLARYRNGVSAVLPANLVCLNAVEDGMSQVLGTALEEGLAQAEYMQRAAQLLAALQPAQVDGVLEAHIDRNLGLEELPVFDASPESCAILLMLVRRAEAARRLLPGCPVVSARAFAERSWPAMLGWSDVGRHGAAPQRVVDLVDEELAYSSRMGAQNGERMRDELMGMLGSILGLSEEQTAELASEEGQRKMREEFERFEQQMRRMADAQQRDEGSSSKGQHPGPMMPGAPFFSQN